MKVGIITFHRALNYGAVLQAYALQKCLLMMGVDCDIIDYRCPYIEQFYKPLKANPLKQPKMWMREMIYAPFNLKKRAKFEDFVQNFMKRTKVLNVQEDLQELNNFYDCFITGSDQVWNFNWSGFDEAYFLNFTETQKKNSYAASFGFDAIPNEMKEKYRWLLKDFRHISVRENTGQSIIKELLNREAAVSIDPSCLINKDEWSKIAIRPLEEGYILLYTLEKSEQLCSYARAMANKMKTRIIYISDALKKYSEFQYKSFLSPREFIGLFMNAGYVVTNSFHGLMFSVIFQKQFCLQYQQRSGAPNSRMIDFVQEFGLENRILSSDKLQETPIDYNSIEEHMLIKRNEAKEYLATVCNIKQHATVTLPISKSKCCGCGACSEICPRKAIEMKADKEGFLYPEINQERCVGCRQCQDVCAFSSGEAQLSGNPLKAIVAYHKNPYIRIKSRSGAVFVAVSDYILKKKGVVYGAEFADDFSVRHGRAKNKTERDKFCGSKYVQSDTENTFMQVLGDLKEGRQVLYSGTACQIAGLKQFLEKKGVVFPTDKLITVDIVCHGVMSPLLWKKNLEEMSECIKGSIDTVQFRDKQFGWDSHIETYSSNQEKLQSKRYTSIFYSHNALRPSCYHCPYASVARGSDITLADAWGVKKVAPEWDSTKGISLVLVNTDNGMRLIDNVSENIIMKEVALSKMLQPNLLGPTKQPNSRNEFWKLFETKGYTYVANQSEREQNSLTRKNMWKARIVRILRLCHLKR